MATNGMGSNGGPPQGSSSAYAGALQIPLSQLVQQVEAQFGPLQVDKNDPAFLPPHDAITVGPSKERSKLIYRDLPLVTVQNTWSICQARSALYANMAGIFDGSAQLCDSILGDDRVMATIGSRTSGLFGRESRHIPANSSAEAQECCDAWKKCWPSISGDSAMTMMHTYGIMMGWSPAQLVWDTSGDVWCPYLQPWHQRFTYYDWSMRKYIALSQDGAIPIMPGDGKWVLHAPHGEYRGWVIGAIRAVTEPWLLRHFAIRDMARFSEVHGMPTRIAETPAAADPEQRAQFEAQVANLGSETTMLIGKGVDEQNSYGYRLVEATDTAWEIFPGLIDRCDMSIVLAILFQNLTTEVKGGSFAAASAHMDIRQGGIQFDAQAWQNTIYRQVARPFAYLNYGDADLAPRTIWDVTPRDEYTQNADQFQKFGSAVEILRKGGVEFMSSDELREFAARKFGLDGIPDFILTDPVMSGGSGGGGFGT